MQTRFTALAAVVGALVAFGSLVAAVQAADSTTTYDTPANLSNGVQVPDAATANASDKITVINNSTVGVTGSVLVGRTTQQAANTASAALWTNLGTLQIGDGTTPTTLTLRNGQAELDNGSIDTSGLHGTGCIVNLAANATLNLQANAEKDTQEWVDHTTQIMNYGGTVNQAGTIRVGQGSFDQIQVDTYGVWNVQNTAATIQRDATSYPLDSTTGFMIGKDTDSQGKLLGTGTLTGAGRLTYVNNTGATGTKVDHMAVYNYGNISPGTNGLGTLELKNMSVTMGSPSYIEIGLGGTSAGQFGVLTLSGAGSSMSFASGSELDIVLRNGFVPHVGDTWTFLNYTSKGAAGFDVVAPGYAVTYYADHADLSYTDVPEPASLGLVLAGLAFLRLCRRRRGGLGTPRIV